VAEIKKITANDVIRHLHELRGQAERIEINRAAVLREFAAHFSRFKVGDVIECKRARDAVATRGEVYQISAFESLGGGVGISYRAHEIRPDGSVSTNECHTADYFQPA
jgi:hypothetical protein